MIKIALTYTPKYHGAKMVSREEKFSCNETAKKFVARMQRMYPDTQILKG